MNQSQIYNAFDGRISKSAIKDVDNEWRIVGKFCYVTYDGKGIWDIWVCNTACLEDGLGQRKVRNILQALNLPAGTPLQELTGEAWAKVRGAENILNNLSLLGIKKKRHLSDNQRQKLAERFKISREVLA